ncbi:MAG: glycosyltransferase family 2 protein [Gallionellaceae bacterium]|jgi:glycosyltransferase involved in cell wall biosynthesis
MPEAVGSGIHANDKLTMPTLSVIIITKNEAANIRACLESVAWAEEIIVVDSGSTDATVSIAREFTPHVYEHDWPGFGAQKNRALSYTKGDWVFSIDADERVTPELKENIIEALNSTSMLPNTFLVSRLSNFCGQFMHHSGWYPDLLPRLFRRGTARFSDDIVHERLLVEGVTEKLQGTLLHYSFNDFEQVLNKINHYSSAGAVKLYEKGKSTSLFAAVFRGLWSFFRTYLLRGGFLDGQKGFILAVSNAEGTYYRYLKLLLKQEKEN